MGENRFLPPSKEKDRETAAHFCRQIAKFGPELVAWVKEKGGEHAPHEFARALVSAINAPTRPTRLQALKCLWRWLPPGALNRPAHAPRGVDETGTRTVSQRARTPQALHRSPPLPEISDYVSCFEVSLAVWKAIEGEDPVVADLALKVLPHIVDGSSDYRVVSILRVALDGGDTRLKLGAMRAMRRCDPTAAASALPNLKKALGAGPVELRLAAAMTLKALGEEARWAIPELLTVLADPQTTDKLRLVAARALVASAPRDQDLEPAKSIKNDERQLVLDVLHAMGSGAKGVRHQLLDVWRSAPRPGGGRPRKPKGSAEPTGAEVEMIHKLIEHHKYDGQSCLNLDPIKAVDLLKKLDMTKSKSTVSEFFKKFYKHYRGYRATCRIPVQLVRSLQILNRDISPADVFRRVENDYPEDRESPRDDDE